MSEFLSLVGEADSVAITLERTKQKVEAAKQALEAAKQELERVKEAYEEVLGRAEAAGISKAKIKKLVEDRILEMANLGLIESAATKTERVKRPAAPRKKKEEPTLDDTTIASSGESTDHASAGAELQ